MNCDNKFGICCKCPAISNIPRELTIWKSSRVYNYEMMKKNRINNANDYRALLQSNAVNIIENTYNDFENNFKCVNNDPNVFYIDSSKFNQYYDNLNFDSKKSDIKNYDKRAARRISLDSMGNNITLSSLSDTPFY
jgi:hypothetical protein